MSLNYVLLCTLPYMTYPYDHLSRREAAEILRVNERTIDRWIRLRRLEAVQIVPNGTVRISVSSIERLLGK